MVILEADAVVVGAAPSRPVSFELGRGEILAVFLPREQSRRPVLEVLSGHARPSSGAVQLAARRTYIASPGSSRAVALADDADLLILDELTDVVDKATERSAWARLAAARAQETAILLLTDRVDQAYRADRVALAMWGASGLLDELQSLLQRMRTLHADLLGLLDEPKERRMVTVMDLQLIKRASRELAAEARSCAASAREREAVQEILADLAGAALDDRILDGLVNERGRVSRLQ